MSDLNALGEPETGLYRYQSKKGAPWFAAQIWFHTADRDEAGDLMEDEGFRCEMDGKPTDPYKVWWQLVKGGRIDKKEYNYLTAMSEHVTDWDPGHPMASPFKTIDLHEQPPIF